MEHIRNFSIIAHINHGKSTLSDRFIQICGGLDDREMKCQVLDSMELERERGITIKSQSVTLNYKSRNGKIYQFNLIDTPGHVDFAYEVSRSLSACEGAILVVDASQGVEAQTIANYKIAIDMNLKIIVILNKIDLLTAEPKRVSKEIKDIIGVNIDNIILCSSKTGFGIKNILERLIYDIPSPSGTLNQPLQALIIDAWFNNYFGLVTLVCIKNGKLNKGDVLQSMQTGQKYVANRIGIFTPKQIECNSLQCGNVGWVVCHSKHISKGILVGDTLTLFHDPAAQSLPGFKKIKPYVYAGLFPINSTEQKIFDDALYKLSLNDSSLHYIPERSEYFGIGYRCGFFGLLHMEIIQERLKREYSLDLIVTAPTVVYEILTIDNRILSIDNPSKLLSITDKIKEIREPIALCNILVPRQYLGEIIKLCNKKRGVQVSVVYCNDQVILTYNLPISEIILDFFDRIKSISQGYASFEYEFNRFQVSNIVCLEILINNQRIDVLSTIIHRDIAEYHGRILVNKLQSLIPRQQFDVSIQAAIANKIICRSNVKQLRKNVISKCYGGDVTRKKKLLYNQKLGKKRMKKTGRINLPNSVFLSILGKSN